MMHIRSLIIEPSDSITIRREYETLVLMASVRPAQIISHADILTIIEDLVVYNFDLSPHLHEHP